MKKRGVIYFALLFLMVLGMMFCSLKVDADGGQVTVDGTIGFYEESTEESTASTATKGKENTKPVGRYPSTGELVQKGLPWLGGGLLVLIAIIWFKTKRSKACEEEENDKK
ncbi:hypothetical protein A5881_002269 [Enterococcus termitis]|nr:hypothetical protein A5881_001411 [Enterococcus termitis]